MALFRHRPSLHFNFEVQLTGYKIVLYSTLQKGYFNYRLRKIKRKKRAGIDPIRTAFDGMKVCT